MTEQELLQQARDGNEGAMHALYNRYAPRVYAVVRRIAGDDGLADDWAQDAWIRVFRALPGFRGDAAFSTWLHRVAVNSALQGKRVSKRHESREEPLPPVLPVSVASGGSGGSGASSGAQDPTVLRIALERALDRLPAGMRQVLVLHDVEGFTHDEIGEMLGIAAGTSKSQLSKARAKMRVMLRAADTGVEGVTYAASEA